MTTEFSVRVAGDDLIFSAAHFITWGSTASERLHGHSYRVAAEVRGPLDESSCVVDFSRLRAALNEIVASLDHRVLLPAHSGRVQIRSVGEETELRLDGHRWVFPTDHCALLPLANTTTELLAQYIGQRLLTALGDGPTTVQIEVDEGDGASAVCELRP